MKMILSINPNEEFVQKVGPVVQQAMYDSHKLLPLGGGVHVDLLLNRDPNVDQYMGGSTGHVSSIDSFILYANPKIKNWEKYVKSRASHEYNHIVRFSNKPKQYVEKMSLADLIASEGLAQKFEVDLYKDVPPYSGAVSKDEALKLWGDWKNKLDDDSVKYVGAFHKKTDAFPHWSGYTLSYMTVDQRMKEMGVGWPEIMGMDSKEIIGGGLR